jgi:hypothetical protein
MNRTVARGTAAMRLWVGAMGLVLVLGFAARAAAQGIAPFGMPMGPPYGFEAPCNRGEVLTGLFLYDDSLEIAGISPQCAIASNPRPNDRAVPARWYGQDPGPAGFQRVACPDIARVLLSIRVKTLTNTDSEIKNFRFFKLETFCGVDGSHPSREQIGGAYATSNVPGWQLGGGTQFCPAGQVAVGIRGRFQSSDGLSELGLICGDPRSGSRGVGQVKQAPPNVGSGAAQSAASRLAPKTPAAALTATPLDPTRNKAAALLLNPHSLSPKTLSAASAATSLDVVRNKTGPVQLNPQPLPPGGLQQVPGSLQQAPSSLR